MTVGPRINKMRAFCTKCKSNKEIVTEIDDKAGSKLVIYSCSNCHVEVGRSIVLKSNRERNKNNLTVPSNDKKVYEFKNKKLIREYTIKREE